MPQARTEQEIFDYVVSKLLKQGCQSITSGGLCSYRGPNGTKCAAGWLIDDEHYTPDLEGESVGAWKVDAALRASGVDVTNECMASVVRRLQFAHDGCTDYGDESFVEQLSERAQVLARSFGLSTAVLSPAPLKQVS